MLYNSSGSLILDKTVTPSFSLQNGKWYFIAGVIEPNNKNCLLYTSDAADDLLCVDLGGRRIIKKKTNTKQKNKKQKQQIDNLTRTIHTMAM